MTEYILSKILCFLKHIDKYNGECFFKRFFKSMAMLSVTAFLMYDNISCKFCLRVDSEI